MKFLPIKEDERGRIACLADELDQVIENVLLIFAGHCEIKVAIHNGVAVITIH